MVFQAVVIRHVQEGIDTPVVIIKDDVFHASAQKLPGHSAILGIIDVYEPVFVLVGDTINISF